MKSFMFPLRSLWSAGFSLAIVALTPATPLSDYVSGWRDRDLTALVKSLSPEAYYQDLDTSEVFDVAELSDYFGRWRGVRFELVDQESVSAEETNLTWRVSSSGGTVTYREKVMVGEGKVVGVESQGFEVSRAEVQPILGYLAGREALDPGRWVAVLAPEFRVYGRTIPVEGYDTAEYRSTLGTYYYTARVGTAIRRAKDLRYYLEFEVRSSKAGSRLASGTDYFTLKSGKIARIDGVY